MTASLSGIRAQGHAELAAVHEVAKILASAKDLDKGLSSAVRSLHSFLGFDRLALYRPDQTTRELRMEASVGYSPEQREKARYAWGEGIVGKTMKSGTPIVLPDAAGEPFFLNKSGTHRKDEKPESVAFLAVPVKIGEEVLGVVTAERVGRAGTQALEGDARTLAIVGLLIAQAMKLHTAIDRLSDEFERQRHEFEKAVRKAYRIDNIVGQGKRMQEVFAQVQSVAPSKATVLLRGESGTGKELIARAIHLAGPRAGKPFVAVNCAALPETLLESELFGHRRGSFTGAVEDRKGRFEEADGGTIFLDEIGDIPLSTQVKLLRVLQERKFARIGENRPRAVDVRIVAATNADLERKIEDGSFREDLFYRLNVIPIFLPPLRERRDDIVPLVDFFLDRYNREHGKSVAFAGDAIGKVRDYRWPGNVRELENFVERAVVMSKEPLVKAHDLPRSIRLGVAPPPSSTRYPPDAPSSARSPRTSTAAHDTSSVATARADGTSADYLKSVEREELQRALATAGWVVARAARLLGWTPRQVSYKMRKHALKNPWKAST